MSEVKEPEIVEVKAVRKVLQKFNQDLGSYINSEERYKLGRVLTIIDASISDPEQRKAIKDLIQNEWWNGGGVRPYDSTTTMHSPHNDLRGLCIALGFELYEPTSGDISPATPGDNYEWVAKDYRKAINEES